MEASIASLLRRAVLPAEIVVVGACAEDRPSPCESQIPVRYVQSPVRSSSTQRNVGIQELSGAIEVVSILDDDCEVHDCYFEEVGRVFAEDPEVVAFSGSVRRNGGVTREEAREILDAVEIPEGMAGFAYLADKWPGLYGCTMNFRRRVVERELFDEELIRYALGEDTEIGFRMARHGKVGGSGRCPVVHLAHKAGRSSEVTVGYSQVANYYYFVRKGIGYPAGKFVKENLIGIPLANLKGIFWKGKGRVHEVDRKGRLKGNLIALLDLVRGRLHPKGIERIGK